MPGFGNSLAAKILNVRFYGAELFANGGRVREPRAEVVDPADQLREIILEGGRHYDTSMGSCNPAVASLPPIPACRAPRPRGSTHMDCTTYVRQFVLATRACQGRFVGQVLQWDWRAGENKVANTYVLEIAI
jgi:hypothetical protein